MKTLVVTRKTVPPEAIARCLEALGNQAKPVFAEVPPNTADIQRVLETEKPKLIFIDGNYSTSDGNTWEKLSALQVPELRLQLIGKAEAPIALPASLNLLTMIRALKKEDVGVVIFIDKPSKAVKEELRRLGATVVWERLNSITRNEASLLKIIQGTKLAAAGVAGVLKELFKKG